jgi:hypothetical protein
MTDDFGAAMEVPCTATVIENLLVGGSNVWELLLVLIRSIGNPCVKNLKSLAQKAFLASNRFLNHCHNPLQLHLLNE